MRRSYVHCPRQTVGKNKSFAIILDERGSWTGARQFSKMAFLQKYCQKPARSKRIRVHRHKKLKRLRTLAFYRTQEGGRRE